MVQYENRYLAIYTLPQIVLMSSSKTLRLANNEILHENNKLQNKLQKEAMSFLFSTVFLNFHCCFNLMTQDKTTYTDYLRN